VLDDYPHRFGFYGLALFGNAAMASLRDFTIGMVYDVTAWIDLHDHDPTLHTTTEQLRATTAALFVDVARPA
jgi:hypothetical protein